MKRAPKNWSAEDVSAVYERVDADLVIALDLPPRLRDGTEERTRKHRRTLENLDILAPRFGNRLVPVVQGRTFDEIEKNCQEIRRRLGNPEWIGLGGLVPLLQQCGIHRRPNNKMPQKFIAESLRQVRSHFRDSLVHVFGAGAIQTMLGLFAVGADSADSIGWRQAAGFGSIYLPGRNQRILSWKWPSRRPRPLLDDHDRHLLAQCNCPACRDINCIESRIARLEANFTPRSIHNLWVLNAEVKAFTGSREAGIAGRFLSRRLSDAWMAVI